MQHVDDEIKRRGPCSRALDAVNDGVVAKLCEEACEAFLDVVEIAVGDEPVHVDLTVHGVARQ